MMEVFGNLWVMEADYRCITTNGTVKRNGEAVMGRGVALQAAKMDKGLAARLGASIKAHGNHVRPIAFNLTCQPELLIAFPVKHYWWERADLALIERSANELAEFAAQRPNKTFLLPRPGCGNGGLLWDDVREVLEPILPPHVWVVERPR